MSVTGRAETLEKTGVASGSDLSRGRPPLLSEQQYARLRRDLSMPPVRFGLGASRWGGKLLAHHLARDYGIALTPRQCRNILRRIVPDRTLAGAPARSPDGPRISAPNRASVGSISSYPNLHEQQRALARLRKLASSGLSAFQFAMAAFDVVADAIPGSETKVMHLSGMSPVTLSPWIGRGIDSKWLPHYQHYVTERDAQQRAIIDPMTMRQKPVYRHEEVMLPHWERSETYNELYRHWACHHVLYVWGLDAGRFMGGLPIWRSATMRPFTNDDVRFASAASALVGHALSVARELESRHAEGEQFVASAVHSAGLITIAGDGRIVAMDHNARQIFGPLAVFEGVSRDTIMREQIAPFLRYIGRTLRDILSHHADGGSWLPPPSACLYLHRSGIALRLHGFTGQGEEGNDCYSVLVETGQIAADRRRRLRLRFGLSPRELDVLRVAGEGRRGAEAAAILGIEPGTFHKYVRQVSEKLGVNGSLNLRSLASELAL